MKRKYIWIVGALVAVLVAGAVWVQLRGSDAGAVEGSGRESSAERSDAELIAGVQKLLATDKQRVNAMEGQRNELNRAYDAASEKFAKLDSEIVAMRAAAESNAQLPVLEERWQQAKLEFELLINRRKAVEQQIDTLHEKLGLTKEALELIAHPRTEGAAQRGTKKSDPDPVTNPPSAAERAAESANEEATDRYGYDQYVVDARRFLAQRQGLLQASRQRVELIDRVMEVSQRDLANTTELLAFAKDEKVALEARREKSPLEVSQRDVDRVQASIDQLAGVVENLNHQLKDIELARSAAVKEIRLRERGVESARRDLEFLQSPFAPYRIRRWFLTQAPKVVMILFVMAFVWIVTRRMSYQITKAIAARIRRGSKEDREERAETFRRVFQSLVGTLVICFGTISLLQEFGVDVTVLLGSAAVLGMAIAFGAQNLIRDYFYGFMILIENQYRVGNVIKIGAISGVVEDISLRITVLRDQEGVAHFIPHSQITTVSNLTHGWSRAVFEVGIAHKESVDRVIELLRQLAIDLRKDPRFEYLMIDEPEMLGVDKISDVAVTIKFQIKTRPLKQWTVKRELLRRIKNAFAEQGIELH